MKIWFYSHRFPITIFFGNLSGWGAHALACPPMRRPWILQCGSGVNWPYTEHSNRKTRWKVKVPIATVTLHCGLSRTVVVLDLSTWARPLQSSRNVPSIKFNHPWILVRKHSSMKIFIQKLHLIEIRVSFCTLLLVRIWVKEDRRII
jgi:hypothetical protein